MTQRLSLLLLVALFLPAQALPCSVCYCGDPTLLPLGLERPESGQLRLSFDGSFLQKESGAPEEIRLVPRHSGADELESLQELRLTVTGALTLRDTTLTTVVPWVSKTLTSPEGSAGAAGAGDIELYLKRQWFLTSRLAPKRHIVSFGGGVKLPTGESSEEPHEMPGSGSFDLLAGPSYTYDADPFSVYISVLGRYNGEGRGGFQYGSSLLVNATARYRLNDYLLLAGQLSGRSTQKDQSNETQDNNSGGAILFAAPQVVVRPKGTWALRGALQIPILERLNGEQHESPIFQFGISYDL